MNNKEKFIKGLLGIGLAGVVSSSLLTGCAKTFPEDENRMALAEGVAQDAGTEMFNVYGFELCKDMSGYYIKFRGHYDNGLIYSHSGGAYRDHQDYLITYAISEEDYFIIKASIYKKANSTSHEEPSTIDRFVELVQSYEPFSVEELNPDDHSCEME